MEKMTKKMCYFKGLTECSGRKYGHSRSIYSGKDWLICRLELLASSYELSQCFIHFSSFGFLFLLQPIERAPRHFNPLVVPKHLQRDLPFKSKPKLQKKQKKPSLATRRAVVMEPDEKRVGFFNDLDNTYWIVQIRKTLFYVYKHIHQTMGNYNINYFVTL